MRRGKPTIGRWGRVLVCWLAVTRAAFAQAPPQRTALVDVNLVDLDRGEAVPHQTILIAQNRIEWIGPTARQHLPAGVTVIRGAGEYAIPGLWDMHVHLTNREWARVRDLPDSVLSRVADYYRDLFLVSGVTGVRDMGGELAELRAIAARWRLASPVPGPRLLFTGQKLGNYPQIPGAPFPLNTATDVRRSIDLVLRAGASHVKLGGLTEARLRDALAECTELKIRCSSHVPTDLPIDLTARMGIASFEHLFLLPENTSSIPFARLEEWRTETRHPTLFQRIAYRLWLRARPPSPADTASATHDSIRAVATFRAIARTGAYVTPTLVLHDLLSRVTPTDAAARDTSLMLEQPTAGLRGETRSAPRIEAARRTYALAELLVRELRRAEVPLLAGTDTPIQSVPGFALLDELGLLVRAGLPPVDAVRAAASNPARFLGADSLGRLAPGTVADLVLLPTNPLLDIACVRHIELVVANGKVLRRPALDSLVADARHALTLLRRFRAPPLN